MRECSNDVVGRKGRRVTWRGGKGSNWEVGARGEGSDGAVEGRGEASDGERGREGRRE